jgi:hypothetical protein
MFLSRLKRLAAGFKSLSGHHILASTPSLKASMRPLLIFGPPPFVAIETEMINAS